MEITELVSQRFWTPCISDTVLKLLLGWRTLRTRRIEAKAKMMFEIGFIISDTGCIKIS